jgi:ribosome-binding protein aMBF1 (putative translation factor)
MGHYCRICGRARANEKFSGKGHRVHVCKDCARLPKEHREAVEQEQEVFGYLKQSHISDKNLRRLRTLASSDQPRIAELAAIVIEVAEVKPYKKRRLKVLARERPDLLAALNRTGLIFAHHDL